MGRENLHVLVYLEVNGEGPTGGIKREEEEAPGGVPPAMLELIYLYLFSQ